MNRWHSWLSHLFTIVVGTSGIAYLWMKYFVKTDDPFAIVNHPLQPFMLDLHVFAAPVLVFLFGLMFESHIQRKLKNGSPSNRRSGVIAAMTFAVMGITGYLLQVIVNPGLMRAALVLHLFSSGVFLLSYIVHQFVNFLLWRKARSRQGADKFAFET